MSRTANIVTRVEPQIKEQAEAILDQLGISMSTAMTMFLRQIVLQRKIPFEMKLPDDRPIELSKLTDEEFNALMEKAVQDYAAGKCTPLADFSDEIKKEILQ